MSKGKGRSRVQKTVADGTRQSQDQGRSSDMDNRINSAIDASIRRFVDANQVNIHKSSKERIAEASYGGGMYDMIMVIRSAMGKWAVEQLLAELDRWNRAAAAESPPGVSVNISGIEAAGVTPEDARELGAQIAKWIETKKGNGKKQFGDPMFA